MRKLSLLVVIVFAAAFASPHLVGKEPKDAPLSPMHLLQERAAKGEPAAIAALRDSAAAGNTDAMNWLGFLYWQGKGTALRQDSALIYLRSAAHLGNPRAMANLGHLLLAGSAEMRDTITALSLLGRAAQSRAVSAIRELSDYYTSQNPVSNPLPQKQEAASTESNLSENLHNIHWKSDSIHAANLRLLADLRARGIVLPYSHSLSIELYNRSAQLGDTLSQRIIRELLEIFPDALSH